jgi:hypothetical protein
MSIAGLALAALVVVIVVSAIRTDLNTGVMAVAVADIIGVYFVGLSVNAVSAYLPAQLVLTLVGISLLFGAAQSNGTLDPLGVVLDRLALGGQHCVEHLVIRMRRWRRPGHGHRLAAQRSYHID